MKEHKSYEKDMVIKGTVIDILTFSGMYYSSSYYVKIKHVEGSLFLMELGQDVTAKFKKVDHVTLQQGEAVVVRGTGACYLRKNDQIELKGQVVKLVLDDRARGESIYILADKVYNETLRFSLAY